MSTSGHCGGNQRVLIVSHSANLSGAERSLLTAVRFLVSAGWHTVVICPRDGPLVEGLSAIGADVHIVGFAWWTTADAAVSVPINRAATKIAELIAHHRSSVVYSNTSVVNVGAIAAMIAGVPHVWHIREFLTRPCFLKDAQREFIRTASNRVIFNSFAVQADTLGPDIWKHASVVYNFVPPPGDASAISFPDTALRRLTEVLNDDRLRAAPKLLVLGAVQPHKRPGDAIRALTLLKPRSHSPHLLIVGPAKARSPYLQELRNSACELGVEDRTHFVGEVAEPYSVIDHVDVVIVCSESEPWGRTAVEAALAGKPVIASRAGGVTEIVRDGETGLLYPPGDVAALASCVDRLLDSPSERADFGGRGRALAQRTYSFEAYGSAIAKHLSAATHERNPAAGLAAYFLAVLDEHRVARRIMAFANGAGQRLSRLRRLLHHP